VRHRPDLITVGEIRGEEAYVLFQALATGHGGLCTMHAEDVETAIKRLTQPPMNIPASIITLMNCVIVVRQVHTPVILECGKKLSSRKFVEVSEIQGADSIINVFNWNPSSDIFQEKLTESILLKRLAKKLDSPLDRLMNEFESRKQLLQNMVENNIRDHRSVNKILSKYYNDPSVLQAKAFMSCKW
jgi:flagellar protein FlaI